VFTHPVFGFIVTAFPVTVNEEFAEQRVLKMKRYELNSHQGSVYATVSDRKLSNSSTTRTAFYTADVVSWADYYSFGQLKNGRHGQETNIKTRYKHQGQESDSEILGEGNSYAYEYRMSDARLGRFWSLDPLSAKYAYNSPYAFSENRVIDGIELEGLEVEVLFDLETNTMYARDYDKWDSDLPTRYVSPEDYKFRWDEGDEKYNQVMVIEDVFTGGHLNEEGDIESGTNKKELPIPDGTYDIVDNRADTKAGHERWFRLDRWDGDYYDDQDDDHYNSDGDNRSGYRLHPGSVSHGCVTVNKAKEIAYDRLFYLIYTYNEGYSWESERRGEQKYYPFGIGRDNIVDFGNLVVSKTVSTNNGEVDFSKFFFHFGGN
jgi:RHS repeat-associated protein